MKAWIKHNIAFFSLVIPFIIMVCLVALAGNLILGLKNIERQAPEAVNDWHRVHTATIDLFTVSPRVSALEGQQGEWQQRVDTFETSLQALRDNRLLRLLGQDTVLRVALSWMGPRVGQPRFP